MRWDILRDEITADPLGRGYATMSDAEVAASLNVADRIVLEPTFVTAKVLMASMDPSVAAGILQKLEDAAATNSAVKWILSFIQGAGDGVDVAHPNTRAQIDALVAGRVLTAAEGDAIKGLARRTVSRARELGLPEIKPWMIAHVRGS